MIKNKILVMSGKGGVGKTTVSANLAYELSKSRKVGILDVDIHGPNMPKIFGLKLGVTAKGNKILPVKVNDNLELMSMGLLLQNETDSVIWRGPLKHKLIQQFINDVEWSDLDYLIIDFPPGTGDEYLSTAQLMNDIKGAIIVSTPQQVSILDSLRTFDFCKKLNIPVLGFIENMSGDVFGKGEVEKIAKDKGVEFFGTVPLKRDIAESFNTGKIISKTEDYFKGISEKLSKLLNDK